MMEQRRIQSFTSSLYQYVVDYPGSQDLSRCDSHEPIPLKTGPGSFDERAPVHHYASEPPTTRSLSAPIDAFNPWIIEGPPCGSPISTSSSISHSEILPTPPYAGLPMYDPVGSPAFHHVRCSSDHETWATEAEPLWKPSYPDVPTWTSQQYSLPYGSLACEQITLQPVQDYIPHAGPPAAPAYLPYHAPVHYPAARVVDSAPLKQELTSNTELSSDSEAEMSDSDDDASLHDPSCSKPKRSGANYHVMKLGRFGTNANLYNYPTASESRHFQCPLPDKENSHVICPKNFQRPEHLRRHVNTVHGDARCHFCKVCIRAFSRGDNLRDHYWTHVKRGGRSGKNRKMTIPELKVILGPKERPLIRRLKMKLAQQLAKNIKSKL